MNEVPSAVRAFGLASPERRVTITLLSSVVLILLWVYGGSQAFYLAHLKDHVTVFENPASTAVLYRFLSALVLLGLVPLLIVKFVFREKLRDYGVTFGIRRRTLIQLAGGVPVFIFLGWASSWTQSMQGFYPLDPEAGGHFLLHAAGYFIFYIAWEFHFRGFLQMGLSKQLGLAPALWIQVMASTLAHLGHPGAETFGTIAGGIFWGFVTYRTKSLLPSLAQHASLGIALDWFLLRR